jgi:hypothetical protein
MYSTNNSRYNFLRCYNLIFGIGFILIGILAFLNVIPGEELVGYFFTITGIVILIPTLVFLHSKLANVRITDEKITLSYKNESTIKEWSEVEKIKRFWLAAPPQYLIKFKNDEKKYYFTTEKDYVSTPFYVFDFSEIGNFIKRKMKEIENNSLNGK